MSGDSLRHKLDLIAAQGSTARTASPSSCIQFIWLWASAALLICNMNFLYTMHTQIFVIV